MTFGSKRLRCSSSLLHLGCSWIANRPEGMRRRRRLRAWSKTPLGVHLRRTCFLTSLFCSCTNPIPTGHTALSTTPLFLLYTTASFSTLSLHFHLLSPRGSGVKAASVWRVRGLGGASKLRRRGADAARELRQCGAGAAWRHLPCCVGAALVLRGSGTTTIPPAPRIPHVSIYAGACKGNLSFYNAPS